MKSCGRRHALGCGHCRMATVSWLDYRLKTLAERTRRPHHSSNMPGVRERIQLPAGHSMRVLRWEKSVRDVWLVLSPYRSIRFNGEGAHWHYHQALELTVFTSGHGTRFVGDSIETFEAGDLVLLGENLPHYWHALGATAGISVQWHFPEGHPFWAFPETQNTSECFSAARRGLRFSGAAAHSLTGLLQQLCKVEGINRLALLLRILGAIVGAPEKDREYLSKQPFSLAPEWRHQTAMRSAIRFLVANFRDDIRLRQLLEVTGMSKATFSRQFRLHAGKPMGRFLQQIRLEAACRELTRTERPIIDIALASGYSEVSFFNRVFRRSLGCNPSQYRRRNRKKMARSISP